MSLDIQTGIYSELAGDALLMDMVTAIYDHVPQASDAGDDSLFPYITIGDDDLSEWGTDQDVGFDATIRVHVWSRARGRAETKRIQGRIYEILHRGTIPLDEYHLVMLDEQLQQTFLDPDGLTYHGVQTFRGLFRALEAS